MRIWPQLIGLLIIPNDCLGIRLVISQLAENDVIFRHVVRRYVHHGSNQEISLGPLDITTLGVYNILNQVGKQSRLRGTLHFAMHHSFALFHFILLASHLPSNYPRLASDFI